MNYTYEVFEEYGRTIIKRCDENGDVVFVPDDLGNRDYCEYLKNLEDEANTL